MGENTNNSEKVKKKPFYKRWWFWTIIGIVFAICLAIVLFFIYKDVSEKQAEEQREKEALERIEECITTTKKNPLGFITTCYEQEDKTAPDEVLTKDKERADRILAQANYDTCLANALLAYEVLWDLNDINPQNGSTEDRLPAYITDFVQKNYDQLVDECRTMYELKGDYERDFKTYYKKKLVGWKTPKSDQIPIIDRYNDNGKIEEWSNMPFDVEVPDSVGSVGELAANAFKKEHAELWY